MAIVSSARSTLAAIGCSTTASCATSPGAYVSADRAGLESDDPAQRAVHFRSHPVADHGISSAHRPSGRQTAEPPGRSPAVLVHGGDLARNVSDSELIGPDYPPLMGGGASWPHVRGGDAGDYARINERLGRLRTRNGIATPTLNNGKVNAISPDVIAELNESLIDRRPMMRRS